MSGCDTEHVPGIFNAENTKVAGDQDQRVPELCIPDSVACSGLTYVRAFATMRRVPKIFSPQRHKEHNEMKPIDVPVGASQRYASQNRFSNIKSLKAPKVPSSLACGIAAGSRREKMRAPEVRSDGCEHLIVGFYAAALRLRSFFLPACGGAAGWITTHIWCYEERLTVRSWSFKVSRVPGVA